MRKIRTLIFVVALAIWFYITAWPASYWVLHETLKHAQAPLTTSRRLLIVERLPLSLVQDVIWRAYHRSQPLIIRNAIKDWPAVQNDSLAPSKMLQLCPAHEPVVLQTDVQEQKNSRLVQTNMGEFVKWLLEHPNREETDLYQQKHGMLFYLSEEFGFIDSHEKLAEQLCIDDFERLFDGLSNPFSFLWRNLPAPQQRYKSSCVSRTAGGGVHEFLGSYGRETAFWMSGAGGRTGLHADIDFSINVLLQLHGKKRIWIAPRSTTMALKPTNKFDPGAVLSSINMWKCLRRGCNDVVFDTADLQAGDLLFIPLGYLHAVESLSHSVSLSLRGVSIFGWVSNIPSQIIETLHLWGLFKPSAGSVVREETIRLDSLFDL